MSEVAAFLFAAPFLLAALVLVIWFIRAGSHDSRDPYQDEDNIGRF